jgi:hypothetical protein
MEIRIRPGVSLLRRNTLMPTTRLILFCLAVALEGAVGTDSRANDLRPSASCCPVVELRQYTTLPGKRDALVRLYERSFIEGQEAAGISLPGQFRVAGFPNRFDWLQGFTSMSTRKADFESFYGGKVWKTHRQEVNSLLLESGNVLLLRPAHGGSGFPVSKPRPPIGSTAEPKGLVVATIYYLGSTPEEQFNRTFENTIRRVVNAHGALILASFVTDHSPNNFPTLPVRGDVNLFVWFACFPDKATYVRYTISLSNDPRWLAVEDDFALARMYIPPEVDLLRPTPRSLLRCST